MARYKGGFRKGTKVKLSKGVYSDGREYRMSVTSGVDNTDMKDLFSLPPDGCLRRLWYKKVLIEPDTALPEDIAKDFERYVCRLYYEQSKRYTKKANRDYRSRTYSYMISHISAFLTGKTTAKSVPGIIKVVTEPEYIRIQYEGIPEHWGLEIQHVITTNMFPWGCILVYCPFKAKVLAFDINADDDIAVEIVKACGDFWEDNVQKKTIPPSFNVDNECCMFCHWRITCHGEQYLVSKPNLQFEVAVNDLFNLQRHETLIAQTKKVIEKSAVGLLGTKKSVITPLGTISFGAKSQTKIDTQKLFKDHPEFKQVYGKPISIDEFKLIPWNKK
jgi:hypothetical protein